MREGVFRSREVVMLRRLLASIALAAVPLFAIPTALVPVAGAAPSGPIQGCMNGGWQTITDVSGQPFKSQGECIAYAIQHPVSLADLASSSVSGTLMSGLGPTGCINEDATLSATFPGSSAIGAVTLQMPGCLLFDVPNFPLAIGFSGTFTITTKVGALSGTVAGGFRNVFVSPFNPQPVTAGFTLTATSGTGLFMGATGTLNLALRFPELGSSAFVGTIAPT